MYSVTDALRICIGCHVEKDTKAFYKSGIGRVTNLCKSCRTGKYNQAKKKPYRSRERNWLRNYGLSADDYSRLHASQDGLCAICHRPERAKASNGEVRILSVDHCHTSGRVRGLLCCGCNVMLSRFKDRPEVFERAAKYLATPKQ